MSTVRFTAGPLSPTTWRGVTLVAGFGMLADVDFLVGVHRSLTHSIGATVVVALVAAALWSDRRLLQAAIVGAAYGSHIVVDWLGHDPVAPFGVMALWPYSDASYVSAVPVFLRVCREYWLVECWWHNLEAVVREVVVLGPFAFVAVRWGRASRFSRS